MSTFADLAEENWTSMFDVNRLKGKNKRFTYTIDSDGIAICMHFTRVKRGKGVATHDEEEQDTFRPGDRVLGVDPGGTNIIYAVEILEDGTVRKYKLTRAQYYRESGIVDAQRHSEHWNNGIRKCLRALSTVTTKGTSLEVFMSFMDVYTQCASFIRGQESYVCQLLQSDRGRCLSRTEDRLGLRVGTIRGHHGSSRCSDEYCLREGVKTVSRQNSRREQDVVDRL